MNTNLLLTASAIVMGLLGIAASFLPQEIAARLGARDEGVVLLVQVAGALLFGFAMINWMARGSLIGAIYNRPLAVGNVAHFVIGALALGKAALQGPRPVGLIAIAVIYVIFAVAFAMVLFQSPVRGAGER
ncbi:MAG TPA: hypothetical protein VF618_14930 [Thermoanaerobaculia bacterium]